MIRDSRVSWLVYLFGDDVSEDAHHPVYDAVATVVHWYNNVCSIRGFCANKRLTHRQLWGFRRYLVEQGYNVTYIERPDGHQVAPLGKLMEEGDFKGMFRQTLT